MKILMVCLGNICRSPLAEGIMRLKLKKHNLLYEVDSAGTGNWHQGEAPDHRSIKIAAENGVDISNQRARGLTLNDLDNFDLIYAMDKENYKTLLDKVNHENQRHKIKLILESINHPQKSEVPDPYYGNLDHFREVYNLLDYACDQLIMDLLKENTHE